MSFIDSVKNIFKKDNSRKIDIPSKYGAYRSPDRSRDLPRSSKKEKDYSHLPYLQQQEIKRNQRRKEEKQFKAMMEKKVPSPLTAKQCPVCKDPMMVSVGSLQFTHGGACRTRARMSRQRTYAKA